MMIKLGHYMKCILANKFVWVGDVDEIIIALKSFKLSKTVKKAWQNMGDKWKLYSHHGHSNIIPYPASKLT